MKIQKDLWVVLNMWFKLLKNRFQCLLMVWTGKLCPISAHDCQMAHSHISTVPCKDQSAGHLLTPSSGAQLSLLGKKILVKEVEKNFLVSFCGICPPKSFLSASLELWPCLKTHRTCCRGPPSEHHVLGARMHCHWDSCCWMCKCRDDGAFRYLWEPYLCIHLQKNYAPAGKLVLRV